MKTFFTSLILLISFNVFAQNKIYFTEDFKELPNAETAKYYSIYEQKDKATIRTTFYINDTIYSKDNYSNYKKRQIDGTSERWYANGKKEYLAIYVKGKQEGPQTRYYESGKVKRIENFLNGSFVDGKCFDENGTEIAFFPYYVKPEFPGGKEAFFSYLDQNFKSVNNRLGEVILEFYVELDGSLNHFEVIKSVKKEIDLAAIKTLVKGPKWIPGKVDGKVTAIKHKLSISI
ncbi:energy transducer TonB [Flavobacterium sp. CHNK8]|uniref:energy transducer TonB n=1 Tax=Flavobacterium sp. CHNK8 TaxID=2871165 RepID=UPI001C8EF6F5|nr:energy transducer TonB [Flavobacterium sp. CHNK8]QZK90586.1 energy transducer TonB [Flavobacterium sp. CHNK8]